MGMANMFPKQIISQYERINDIHKFQKNENFQKKNDSCLFLVI